MDAATINLWGGGEAVAGAHQRGTPFPRELHPPPPPRTPTPTPTHAKLI
jgi:hypothetical protein